MPIAANSRWMARDMVKLMVSQTEGRGWGTVGVEITRARKENPPALSGNSAGGRLQVVGANTCKVAFPTK